MTFAELRYLIYADLYRYHGRTGPGVFLRELLWGIGGKFGIWLRVTSFLARRSRLWLPLYLPARLMLRRYTIRFGIHVPFSTAIGPGLCIPHPGGIFVSARARIGRNCNLSHGVTIGVSNRGQRQGCPTIGDNVYLGPGAKIFGKVTVGNGSAVGANCVVTRDVPENGVVVGVPGRVISLDGSAGYVNRTDYDRHLRVPLPFRSPDDG
ncbi:MAG: serine acetyltransferase [Phycisphaerae bacterium]|jgi:serine O-acetyltransferase